MLIETLQTLGFSDKEATVYLEVSKRGKANPALIARSTGINRATVYNIAQALIERGVIAGDLGGRSLYLTALPPEELTSMLARERRALEKKERAAKSVVQELRTQNAHEQYSLPKIQFIDEIRFDDFLFGQIDKWNASAKTYDSTHWGFQDHSFAEHYEDWIQTFWEKSHDTVQVKLISNRSLVERKLQQNTHENRAIRYWKDSFDFTASVWVIGDYIVMLYTKERPFYAIEIYNPVLADNMRKLFSSLWEEVTEEQ